MISCSNSFGSYQTGWREVGRCHGYSPASSSPGIGLADTLEMASVPQLKDITEGIRALAGEKP